MKSVSERAPAWVCWSVGIWSFPAWPTSLPEPPREGAHVKARVGEKAFFMCLCSLGHWAVLRYWLRERPNTAAVITSLLPQAQKLHGVRVHRADGILQAAMPKKPR